MRFRTMRCCLLFEIINCSPPPLIVDNRKKDIFWKYAKTGCTFFVYGYDAVFLPASGRRRFLGATGLGKMSQSSSGRMQSSFRAMNASMGGR